MIAGNLKFGLLAPAFFLLYPFFFSFLKELQVEKYIKKKVITQVKMKKYVEVDVKVVIGKTYFVSRQKPEVDFQKKS